mmetsp:Transcript_47808/g.104070  ORF Transcript_47808/g.104070 Transcript_47808/m.104070 type:complete len:228 (+) Transcript_47808:204-887(+)
MHSLRGITNHYAFAAQNNRFDYAVLGDPGYVHGRLGAEARAAPESRRTRQQRSKSQVTAQILASQREGSSWLQGRAPRPGLGPRVLPRSASVPQAGGIKDCQDLESFIEALRSHGPLPRISPPVASCSNITRHYQTFQAELANLKALSQSDPAKARELLSYNDNWRYYARSMGQLGQRGRAAAEDVWHCPRSKGVGRFKYVVPAALEPLLAGGGRSTDEDVQRQPAA